MLHGQRERLREAQHQRRLGQNRMSLSKTLDPDKNSFGHGLDLDNTHYGFMLMLLMGQNITVKQKEML
jgi:hypothetical protein